MNIHEYQAKKLLGAAGIPVSQGEVVSSAEEAEQALQKMGLTRCVVKAQVHAGGRGKAGGVLLLDDKEAILSAVKSLIGRHLVTHQTTAQGQIINQVLLEEPCTISRELYLGVVLDRSAKKLAVMASTEGGVDIEKVAEETPDKILQCIVDPLAGIQPYQCRDFGFKLGLNGKQIKQFTQLVMTLVAVFIEKDLSLVEINPLVVTGSGDLLCLDAKINVDENALYRQADLRDMRDITQEDERESKASQWELNYIALEGTIGCMVNGAGLAMATMDAISLYGGEPANFLDVGGSATQERVAEAFKIILSDTHVRAVFVNIFGGIVRCDLIAEGIINAVKEVGVSVPVVVRLEGNNADKGRELLKDSGLNICAAESFAQGAKQAVAQAKGDA